MTGLEIALALGCGVACFIAFIVICVAEPPGSIAEREKKYAQLQEEHDRWKTACEASRKEHDACVRELATANAHWKNVLALNKASWDMTKDNIDQHASAILSLLRAGKPEAPAG